MPGEAYLHFMVSLVLCGLMAAAYPFLMITFLSVRVFYPPLFQAHAPGAEDLTGLERMGRLVWRYLLLAASVPMLAVAVLVLVGSNSQLALGVLSAGGLTGFGLAFWLSRLIEEDLGVLVDIIRHREEHEASG
jgi:hypothetical protein